MSISKDEEIIDCINAKEWEEWLDSHYELEGGVWLKIAKKGSRKTSVAISEALDVALCYGWIDSQRKGFDSDFYLQRYSPRRLQSPWSKLNVLRAEALMESGRMKPAGIREIENARRDGRWQIAYESQRNFVIPSDFDLALQQSDKALETFRKLEKTEQYVLVLPILKATNAKQRSMLIGKAIATLEKAD